jgi:hypothetical protein
VVSVVDVIDVLKEALQRGAPLVDGHRAEVLFPAVDEDADVALVECVRRDGLPLELQLERNAEVVVVW